MAGGCGEEGFFRDVVMTRCRYNDTWEMERRRRENAERKDGIEIEKCQEKREKEEQMYKKNLKLQQKFADMGKKLYFCALLNKLHYNNTSVP